MSTPDFSCRCSTFARDFGRGVVLSHHPKCEKYNPEPEMRELLQDLVNGIEAWAAEDGGVFNECWKAYVNACNALFKPANYEPV